MRVTIGQINTTNGDFDGNTASIIRAIDQAKKEKSDLVVLPEVCIHGYTSLDWFLDRDVVQHSLEPLNKIIAATENITAIVGTVRPTVPNWVSQSVKTFGTTRPSGASVFTTPTRLTN